MCWWDKEENKVSLIIVTLINECWQVMKLNDRPIRMLDLLLNKWTCSQQLTALIFRSRNILKFVPRDVSNERWIFREASLHSGAFVLIYSWIISEAEPQLTLEPHYTSFLFDCSSLNVENTTALPHLRFSKLLFLNSSECEQWQMVWAPLHNHLNLNKMWDQDWDQEHGWRMTGTKMSQFVLFLCGSHIGSGPVAPSWCNLNSTNCMTLSFG